MNFKSLLKSFPKFLAVVVLGSVVQTTFAEELQGQDSLDNNGTPSGVWSKVNLQNWKELQYIPCRRTLDAGPATGKAIEIIMPHSKNGIPGFQSLTSFQPTANVVITEGPTLSISGETWTYTMKVNVTDNQPGAVEFFARMRAGAHNFGGSSLQLGSPTLQIHKPGAGPEIPDLTVKKIGPSSVYPGQTITYTLFYTNTLAKAVGVQLTDTLPNELTYVDASASDGGTISGNTIVWDLGDLPAGAKGKVTYQATVDSSAVAGSQFSNHAEILCSQDEADSSNNISIVKTTVVAPGTPIANPDDYQVDENTALDIAAPGILFNDSHAQGKTLSATLVSGPSHGSLVLQSNGAFSYTPNLDYRGVDTFSYKVSDGAQTSSPATVTLTVLPVNKPPLAPDDSYDVNQNSLLTIAAPGILGNDSDSDGDTVTAVLVSGTSHGTLVLSPDGSFTYQPDLDFIGADTFTYQANDGKTNSVSATVTITVNGVNHAPVGVNDSYSIDENTQLTTAAPGVLGNDSDEDGDPLTAVLVSAPANGNLSLNPDGSFTYIPTVDYSGVDTFTYRASDGSLSSDSVTVTISIKHINRPPTVTIVSPTNNTTFVVGQNITIVADAFDSDGVVTNVEFFCGTNKLGCATNTPFFVSWTNAPAGSYDLTAIATDDSGLMATSSVVKIQVLEQLPLTFIGPIQLDRQTGLFKQTVRILNPTPFALEAARVLVFGLTPEAKVFNASGVNNGIPYVQFNQAIPPGASAEQTIEFSVPSRIQPKPLLVTEIVPMFESMALTGTPQKLSRALQLKSDKTFLLEFSTVLNRSYAVQYTSDLVTWKTVVPTIVGNGSQVQWIDNGAPKTDSAPTASEKRFYRVILLP